MNYIMSNEEDFFMAKKGQNFPAVLLGIEIGGGPTGQRGTYEYT